MKRITILGATGSVGRSTRRVLAEYDEPYEVVAVVGGADVDALAEAAVETKARFAAIADPARYEALKAALASADIEVGAGPKAVMEAAARDADWVMAAIVGAAGLEPTLQAVRRGASVALANKECLVCAGELFMREARAAGAAVLAVDSEHNAMAQALTGQDRGGLEKLILTASGGPFRTWDKASIEAASPAQAVAHPNFAMGAKISTDSASLMNKGLELIEAMHLFDAREDEIDIVVHPEQIIHSLVSFKDGSVLAQLGAADMRTPIAHALAWPRRMGTSVERLDLARIGSLHFEEPDLERFPCLGLARRAAAAGGGAPTVLNAANEIAVSAFLEGRIGFGAIAGVVEAALNALDGAGVPQHLDEVRALDAEARRRAGEALGGSARAQLASPIPQA